MAMPNTNGPIGPTIDRAIGETIDQDCELRRRRDLLSSVIGVGETLAALLLTEMPEPGVLRRSGEIVAYASSTRAITGPAPQSTARRASPKSAMPLCIRRSTCRHLSAMRSTLRSRLSRSFTRCLFQATGTLPEATKERRPVALRNLRVTEFVVRHRQVVLPGGATGVRFARRSRISCEAW